MDIERLKEDIRNVESDLEYGEYQDQGKVAVNVECLRSVIDFANETIAHQSVTEMAVCPNCNGSGVYQEYDEYDRYHVFACYKCEGTGEIARQSVTSEEVAEAIEQFTKR